jgi:hypothetical protein
MNEKLAFTLPKPKDIWLKSALGVKTGVLLTLAGNQRGNRRTSCIPDSPGQGEKTQWALSPFGSYVPHISSPPCFKNKIYSFPK